MNRRTVSPLAVVSIVVLGLALVAVGRVQAMPTEAVPTASTLDDLQAAYNGESNAHARYLAFAAKADEEGYGAVASLFRAAARAEEIHAANHAEVIELLGAEAAATIEDPDVKSTRENLEAAIAGETYERDTMYPEFLARARREVNADAIQTFNYAKTAEAEHARLYKKALDELDTLADSAGTVYYVCTVCGNTTTNLDFSKCPSCFEPKSNYRRVS